MLTSNRKKVVYFFIVSALLIVASFNLIQAQADTKTCDQCGMSVDAIGQARYKIVDSSNQQHIACCPVCALRLQRTYGDLNITSFCDYNGPSYPITIISRNNGTDVTVNPSTALIIAAGSCTKNRLVYDSSAADNLLALPNNGTSKWLSPLTNSTVAANATRLGVVQAALMNGAGIPNPTASPSPSPSPSSTPVNTPIVTPSVTPGVTLSPTPSPKLTSGPSVTTPVPLMETLECEVCGMDVSPESQIRYKAIDGNKNAHYVECYMCALALIDDYESMHIETYCDWFGPGYPVIVDSSNYGGDVSVSPSDAVYLRGGSCVTARVAYNQTAADNLLLNGYSQFTSPEQLYKLPPSTEVKSVVEAIEVWYSQPNTTNSLGSTTLVLIAIIGAIIIIVSVLAFRKIGASSKKSGVKN